MAFKRKDVGRGYSPARKPMSRSTLGLGSCRSPRRGLSTSFQAHSKPTVSARPGARIGGKPVHSSQGSTANMKVVVRVRPLSERERESNTKTIVDIVDEKMLVFDPKREEESFFFRGAKQRGRDMMKKPNKHTQFLFDSVFGCEATNEAVFEGSTKGIVSSVLDGFNCSVFVYGATGAGKTFTMLGTQENPGITFRTMVDLFRQMDDQQKEKDFEIGVSYLEVYNEAVKDLLNPNSGPVHLREEGGNVYASGLKTEMITDPNHMFSLLEYGNKNRTQEATDANSESSRSHAVFQVFIKIKIKTNGQTKMVKLSMIDLAGSERGAATGCAGARFKEGSNINKSLLALGNCINALADGQRHIPYRDSKLTRLLKDSLGGNCQTVMIANISPAHHTYEDTHNTLKYATRAKNIKFQLKKNIVSVQLHVSHYIKMVEDLQAEVARLKNQSVSEAQSFKAENELLRKELEEYKIQNLAVPSLTYEHSSHLPPAIAAVNSEMRSAVSVSSIATNTSPVKETENQKDYKAFLEEAEKLYSDKAAIHQRYLSMNSSDKVLRWRIKMKQRTIDRVVAMSSTPSRLDLAQTKVDKSVEKFEAMISTANDCQEAVSEEEREINLKLLRIQEELRERGVFDQVAPFWNAFELRFLNQELSLKCQNLEKLVKYLDHSFERHDEMLQNVSALFRKYYNLVRGHGHMNEELRKEHEAVMQALEGMKFVQFEPKATTVYFSPLEIDGDRPLMPETRFENQSEIASASRLQQVSAPGSPLVNSLSQSGNVLDKALDLQSPVNISSSNSNALSKHMDTVSMLGNLEVLDSKVDNILNTSISSTAVEVGCKWNDVEAGLISEDERIPLNTTFDADGNLNATFTKDDSPEIQNNLNETFDKPEDEAAAEPSISNLNMNETFLMKERSCNQKTETELKMQRLLPVQSIPSPQLSGGRSPIEKNVNSHLIKYEKSPLIESSRIPSPRSPLRLKVSGTKDSLNSPLTSLAAGFEKKQEASSSTSQPNNTAMKTSVLSSNSTSSVASTQIKMPASSSPSCTQFVVPSSAPVKSIPSGRRVVKAGAVEKRKAPSLAIGSNTVLPIKSTSSSIGRDRRALAPVLKLPSSTPNKVKPIWNKENRSTSANTLLKSLPLNKVTKLSGGIKPVMRPPVTSVLANPSPK